MIKNGAGQKVGGQLASAVDGSNFTGTVTVYVTGDAGTQAIGSVGSGICTHEGNGYHTYTPTAAETNYDLIAFTFIGTGAVSATVQVYTEQQEATTDATTTSSASANFAMTRDDIIRAAAEETGEVAEGEDLTPDRTNAIALRLNSWVKSLMATGAKLWALKQATLFLTVGTANYTLGATGDHCTNDYIQTTLSTAEALGSTSLGLTAFAGMAASDNIGIVLDSGSIHWTTISGAPGATTTIATGLASAAAAGNVVFTYTSLINRPQRIDAESAYWHSNAGQDTPIKMISRSEYARLANKSSSGKIVQAYYNPQLVNGILSVWPTPDSSTDVLKFWYERILEDFDLSTDTPDFAIEWGEALILGLASRIAPATGMARLERQELKQRADEALFICMGFDRDDTPVFFQPAMQ